MPATHPALPAAALSCLLFNALIWGLSWWPFRQLHALGLHSLWATAIALALSSLALGLGRPQAWSALRCRPRLVWLALAAGITNAAFNSAVLIGEVVRVVLLFYLMPVWSLLLARWLLRESITPAALARVALALGGAAIVLWRPQAGLPLPASLADWLGIIGGASFALVNVLVRRHRDDPESARALAMLVGGASVPAALGIMLASLGLIAPVPVPAWPWIAGSLGLAAALLAGNLALQYGAARLPASVTAIVMLSEVLFAATSAVILGGEALQARTIVGGLLIVGATLLAALQAGAPAPPTPAPGDPR